MHHGRENRTAEPEGCRGVRFNVSTIFDTDGAVNSSRRNFKIRRTLDAAASLCFRCTLRRRRAIRSPRGRLSRRGISCRRRRTGRRASVPVRRTGRRFSRREPERPTARGRGRGSCGGFRSGLFRSRAPFNQLGRHALTLARVRAPVPSAICLSVSSGTTSLTP